MYNRHKQELDEIFDDIAKDSWIPSRYQWYEKWEKSNKFFLNLEKKPGIQGQIWNLIVNNKEISESTQRLNYFIKPCLKECREIFCWVHSISRYSLVTYT